MDRQVCSSITAECYSLRRSLEHSVVVQDIIVHSNDLPGQKTADNIYTPREASGKRDMDRNIPGIQQR